MTEQMAKVREIGMERVRPGCEHPVWRVRVWFRCRLVSERSRMFTVPCQCIGIEGHTVSFFTSAWCIGVAALNHRILCWGGIPNQYTSTPAPKAPYLNHCNSRPARMHVALP